MRKVVLLDFDGVVLKNHSANIQVVKRAGIYTWRATKRQIGFRQASELCRNVYVGYGHTVLGLQSIGVDANLTDYNKFVYSTIDYKKLRPTNNSFEEVRALSNFCQQNNIETYMFTNAPFVWVEEMLQDEYDILAHFPDIRRYIGVSSDNEKYLKPSKDIYEAINQKFKDYKQIVFVDDNSSNFKPCNDHPLWTNVLYCTTKNKISNKTYLANSLTDVTELLSHHPI